MSTIVDIAQKLNISTSTVSRALCDSSGVSEQTRELVKQTAHEMNYSINRFAKNLVMQKSYTIGFMIPDISDNFFSKAAYGVESVLKGSRFSLAYTNVQRDENLILEYLKHAVEYKYDGVFITIDNWSDSIVEQMYRMNLPIISLRRKTPTIIKKIPYIDSDNIDGVKQIVGHLVSLGHKDIGFIGFDSPVGKERSQCYIIAASEYKLPICSMVYPAESSSFHNANARISLGYKSAQALLEKNPNLTAIVGGDDQLAIGALQYAFEKGIKVPEQLSITGYDDRDIASMYCIQLTTMRQELYEIGCHAGKMMLSMIENPGSIPANEDIKTNIKVRNTTGICRIN